MARFIAEIGSNHNRDPERARQLIDASAAAGCQAVKLQVFRVDDLFAPEALAAKPELLDRRAWEFPLEMLPEVRAQCTAANLELGATPFGLWAVEVIGIADFIGFTGLSVPRFEAHFTPCIEIGWRLAFDYWGHGYATEAACAARDYGFRQLGLREIVSFTVTANQRSRKVMERIGMTHFPEDDFHHPLLPEGHPLRYPVLYRLGRPVL